ncbi:MAG: protein-L-isoaspartate O-methyltransferase family protein [Janthinobacterium lividum]
MSETLITPPAALPAAAIPPTLGAIDYADARDRMVDGQVRPNKVIDPRLILAMRRLPRERFVPDAMASRAYADEDVPLPNGRALMEPMVIARLVQGLRVRDGERALVVGAGSGYGAALLAACGARVVALEDDAALVAIARVVLPGVAPGIKLVEGPLAAGWPGEGPYDVILVEGAVPAIPEALTAQLKPEGRLATVLVEQGGPGRGVLAEVVPLAGGNRLRSRAYFECATPMLPQLVPPPAFTF